MPKDACRIGILLKHRETLNWAYLSELANQNQLDLRLSFIDRNEWTKKSFHKYCPFKLCGEFGNNVKYTKRRACFDFSSILCISTGYSA